MWGILSIIVLYLASLQSQKPPEFDPVPQHPRGRKGWQKKDGWIMLLSCWWWSWWWCWWYCCYLLVVNDDVVTVGTWLLLMMKMKTKIFLLIISGSDDVDHDLMMLFLVLVTFVGRRWVKWFWSRDGQPSSKSGCMLLMFDVFLHSKNIQSQGFRCMCVFVEVHVSEQF